MNEIDLLTIRQAAELKNVAISTVYQWLRSGRLTPYSLSTVTGSYRAVSRAEIEQTPLLKRGRPARISSIPDLTPDLTIDQV